MSVTTEMSSLEFNSQKNLSLDAMKSRLDIKKGQAVFDIIDKKQTYL